MFKKVFAFLAALVELIADKGLLALGAVAIAGLFLAFFSICSGLVLTFVIPIKSFFLYFLVARWCKPVIMSVKDVLESIEKDLAGALAHL